MMESQTVCEMSEIREDFIAFSRRETVMGLYLNIAFYY